MDEPNTFRVDIRPRCFDPDGPSGFVACGELAGWMRPSTNGWPVGYYCFRHRQPIDVPIPDSYVVTRVSLKLEIVFSGISFRPSEAKGEALERARAAIERVGGVLNVLQLSANVGRYVPPVPRRGENGDGGMGQ